MATTNYTTKTAALRATKADMRQVAVSKKIEIGKSGSGTTVSEDEIKTTNLMISEDGTATGEKVNVRTLIQNAADNAAITVGRDADKDWNVDATSFPQVKKISFLGDYVNVVQGANGEVKLYIGENKSLPDMNMASLSGQPSGGTSYRVFTSASPDDFTLPVAAGNSATVYALPKEGTAFSDVTMTAKSSASTPTDVFTLDQTNFIWVRTKYNGGTYSDWGKISLALTRSNVGFAASTNDGEVALPTGIISTITNKLLTTDDAKYGKIPGRCETSFTLTIQPSKIATKNGGTIEVQWIVANNKTAADGSILTGEPATSDTNAIKTISFFVSKYKDVAFANSTLTLGTITDTLTTVSGISYRTSGTTAVVTTPNINNSQWKVSRAGDERCVINAAGKSTTFKRTDASTTATDKNKLVLVSGTSITNSDAVYKVNEYVATLGSTGNKGTASISAVAYGKGETSAISASVSNFWGNPAASVSTTVEPWGAETHRYADVACTTSWKAADDVTTKTVTIAGVNTIGAVAQYGQLMHPAKAGSAVVSKPTTYATSGATPASYIRKFTLSAAAGKFKVSGTNIGKINSSTLSDVKVYWVNPRNGGLVELSDETNGQNSLAVGSITHAVESATEDASATNVIIFVIPANSSTKIGQVTVASVQ